MKTYSEFKKVNEMQSHELEPNVDFTDITNALRGEPQEFVDMMPTALVQIKTHLGIKSAPIDVVGLNRDHSDAEESFFNQIAKDGTFVNSFNGVAGNDQYHHYKLAIYKGIVYTIDMDGGLVFRRRINGDP